MILSGTMRLTLWEEEVGKWKKAEVTGKFLSTSKQNSTVEKVDDIGDVEEEDDNEEGSTVKYHYDVWFKGKEGWLGSAGGDKGGR